VFGRSTVDQRVAAHGPAARSRLVPLFRAAGVPYPPPAVVLVGLKQERELQLYAGRSPSELRHISSYDVLAASGELGPKLAEGDRQVPEGLYRIESLNPNSRFHLSLRVNYPSPYDLARAEDDDRINLGGDIMIHGAAVSIGCLAVGDDAAEDLFVLAAEAGPEKVRLILSPVDFRVTTLPASFRPSRLWISELHAEIRSALAALPPPSR